MNTMDNLTSSVNHCAVSRDEWLARRQALLAQEKQLSQLRDRVAQERRALPWVLIDKHYVFETRAGRRTLAELFEGRRQLLVQHFMLAPGREEGCAGCSYMADHVDGMRPHLQARDVGFVAISRAPLAEIERFRHRMGWQFDWASSNGSDFNHDFGVTFTPQDRAEGHGKVFYNYAMRPLESDEWPGISAFFKNDAGEVFHTYSTYGRGVEVMMGTYNLLDLMPEGRGEGGQAHKMAWVRHHDRYEAASPSKPAPPGASCCAARA